MKIVISDFIHRIGYHCESSSMRDLFEFYGFPMSEPMAFGLDGTLGFGFFDTSSQMSFVSVSNIPFFLGGKQGTIEPNSLACRLLGITLRKQSFSNADKAWEESKKLLNQNSPLILRLDIAYMPYEGFDQELHEAHFGGHAVSLAGYDEKKGVVFIGDTEFEGFQEVPIEGLKTARSSIYGPKFLHPNNTQFSMIPRPDGKHPPLAAGVKVAIQQVVNNMLRPSMNNIGMQGLNLFSKFILNWNEKLSGTIKNSRNEEVSLAKVMFELTYAYIETWGTGGALFRKLYKLFLEEILQFPEIRDGQRAWKNEEFKLVSDAIPHLIASLEKWTAFANILKNAASNYKEECLNYVNLNELHSIILEIISEEEQLWKKLSKLKI
jgi:hypothetical protein